MFFFQQAKSALSKDAIDATGSSKRTQSKQNTGVKPEEAIYFCSLSERALGKSNTLHLLFTAY